MWYFIASVLFNPIYLYIMFLDNLDNSSNLYTDNEDDGSENITGKGMLYKKKTDYFNFFNVNK